MKVKFIILILGLIFISCDNSTTLTKEFRLNGKVSKIITKKFSVIKKFGEYINDTLYSKVEFTFNKKGDLIHHKQWKGKKTLLLNKSFEYRENGDKFKEINYYYNEPIISRINNVFNAHGILIEENKYSLNTILEYKIKFNYDDNGRLISKITYNPDGREMNSYNYQYYNSGNLEISYYEHHKCERFENHAEILWKEFVYFNNEMDEIEIRKEISNDISCATFRSYSKSEQIDYYISKGLQSVKDDWNYEYYFINDYKFDDNHNYIFRKFYLDEERQVLEFIEEREIHYY